MCFFLLLSSVFINTIITIVLFPLLTAEAVDSRWGLLEGNLQEPTSRQGVPSKGQNPTANCGKIHTKEFQLLDQQSTFHRKYNAFQTSIDDYYKKIFLLIQSVDISQQFSMMLKDLQLASWNWTVNQHQALKLGNVEVLEEFGESKIKPFLSLFFAVEDWCWFLLPTWQILSKSAHQSWLTEGLCVRLN